MFLSSVCCSRLLFFVLFLFSLFSWFLFLWTWYITYIVPLRGTLLLDYMPSAVFISTVCLPSCPTTTAFYMFWNVCIFVFCTMITIAEAHSPVIWWKAIDEDDVAFVTRGRDIDVAGLVTIFTVP